METDQIDPRNVMMRLGVKKLGIFPHLLRDLVEGSTQTVLYLGVQFNQFQRTVCE